MRIAVVGATGMVGTIMLKVLREQNFPITDLIMVASEKSIGTQIDFGGLSFPVVSIQSALELRPDIAIFSAGGDISLEWAPKFAEVGTKVIDNSSAWRMDPTKKLIVPEINGHLLTKQDFIIANPNCSTIQLVLTLAPLHAKYSVKRVVISTYQSITGTGVKAVQQMENERAGIQSEMAYKYPIDKNCIPQCDVFLENGYTKEEMKLSNETKKILGNDIELTATCVRLPVLVSHSESANIEFEKPFTLEKVREALDNFEGCKVIDERADGGYSTPLEAEGKDETFISRIREDKTVTNGLNIWIVSDNLLRGAALNAVEIAETLIKNNFYGK